MNKNPLNKLNYIWIVIGALTLLACKSPDAPAVAAADDAVITYQREGGFAGLSEEWQIFPDGRIVGPDEQEMQVPREEVAPLFEQAAQLESSAGDKSYISDDACCDQFIYTITFSDGGQETTLRTSDAADHPESVASLISMIEGLLSMEGPLK